MWKEIDCVMIPFYLQKFYCISMHYMQYQMSLCTVLVSNQNSFETGIQSTYYIVLPIWLNHLMETRPFSPPSLNPWNSQWPQNRRMSAPVKACTSYLCFKVRGFISVRRSEKWPYDKDKNRKSAFFEGEKVCKNVEHVCFKGTYSKI